jgi:hypothetical protein
MLVQLPAIPKLRKGPSGLVGTHLSKWGQKSLPVYESPALTAELQAQLDAPEGTANGRRLSFFARATSWGKLFRMAFGLVPFVTRLASRRQDALFTSFGPIASLMSNADPGTAPRIALDEEKDGNIANLAEVGLWMRGL